MPRRRPPARSGAATTRARSARTSTGITSRASPPYCSQCTEVPGWPAITDPFNWVTASVHWRFGNGFEVFWEGKNLSNSIARTYLNGNPLLPWAPGQNIGASESGVGYGYSAYRQDLPPRHRLATLRRMTGERRCDVSGAERGRDSCRGRRVDRPRDRPAAPGSGRRLPGRSGRISASRRSWPRCFRTGRSESCSPARAARHTSASAWRLRSREPGAWPRPSPRRTSWQARKVRSRPAHRL